MNSARDQQIDEVIRQRATEWYVRHREGELSFSEQRQYLEWLRASPHHVSAYLSVIMLTAKLPSAIDGLNLDVEALACEIQASPAMAEQALFGAMRSPAAPSGTSGSRTRYLAMAASIVLLIGVSLFWAGDHFRSRSIVVPPGQQRMLTLEDGSVVHLNSGTRMILRYSDARRLIELPAGQALFSVVHDARRPFIVRTGPVDVVAVGTRFDVARDGEETRVTVVEGRIELVPERPAATPQTTTAKSNGDVIASSAPAPLRLDAGKQVRFVDKDGLNQPTLADVQVVTAWTRRELAFSHDRLADIATQFNQFTGVHISIESAALRDYRISGVFQAYDLDSFLAYLQQLDGVEIERDGDEVRVQESR